MAYVNRFNVLAGLLPAEIEDLEGALDADVLEGLEYISSDEEDEDLFAGHPLAPNPLAADDLSNPWKIAGPRRIARNPNRVPQPDVPTPPERITELEFLWTPMVCGSLSAIRKWSQVRKSGCIQPEEGLAGIIY